MLFLNRLFLFFNLNHIEMSDQEKPRQQPQRPNFPPPKPSFPPPRPTPRPGEGLERKGAPSPPKRK